MPRGRHRHSPPLHRLLPPSTVAGVSIACATGAWFVGDDLVQRVLAAGAAAAAIGGAVMMRAWDRKAGRKVAELTRARVRDEWRTEERIAELETDVEESREIRSALETKLRAKRAELARLRSEHAELLRRYATAETERASALEGRRLLAIEASAPAKALPVPSGLRKPQPATAAPARASAPSSSPDGAPAESSDRPTAAPDRDAASPARAHTRAAVPAPALYAQADRALRRLARSAARQRDAAQGAESRREAAQDGEGRDKHRAATTPALRPVPAAAAAVPPPRPTVSRTQGGFDFFGNATPEQPRQLTAPLEEDLADVVGDEAVAEQSARAQEARTAGEAENAEEADRTAPGSAAPDGATTGGVGEVIDLTAHDETEQLDMVELRTALS
ncbi:hypothetical protein [Streptomyces gilvosporeus]|uniref:hypothetical protein n=1 Tax=Streptomyces gilvosporeus TaxID=553510 RepID=UPI0019397097|nr:hypothetical protein [Streptomyces gilvosporeus]